MHVSVVIDGYSNIQFSLLSLHSKYQYIADMVSNALFTILLEVTAKNV